MPVVMQGLNLGDLLKYEAPNLYSRDRAALAAGQNLRLGTVLGMITATGRVKQLDPSATDGSQYACAVLMQDCDATLAERDDALILARHAVVADHALTWPASMAEAEHLAALHQLKALGILVRQGV